MFLSYSVNFTALHIFSTYRLKWNSQTCSYSKIFRIGYIYAFVVINSQYVIYCYYDIIFRLYPLCFRILKSWPLWSIRVKMLFKRLNLILFQSEFGIIISISFLQTNRQWYDMICRKTFLIWTYYWIARMINKRN